jgi:hypothetical protein
MDYYLDNNNAIDRLVDEWVKYRKIIVAYDYDDTVFDYWRKGRKYTDVINLLQECRKYGAYFVVFTACGKDQEESIANYLTTNDIPFDKINENIDFITFTGRKIYYNILLDDRSGLKSAYECLSEALKQIKIIRRLENE